MCVCISYLINKHCISFRTVGLTAITNYCSEGLSARGSLQLHTFQPNPDSDLSHVVSHRQ